MFIIMAQILWFLAAPSNFTFKYNKVETMGDLLQRMNFQPIS